MFEYIKGKITSITPSKIILEANQIGYCLFIPTKIYSSLKLNSFITIYTSLVIKEDGHFLYGFLSLEEKKFFNLLKTISGIGPKTALSLISHMDIEDFQKASIHSDTKTISKVPGIGKKTAQRILIEIKDKLKHLEKEFLLSKSAEKEEGFIFDAINALIHLGYNPMKARLAIKKALEELGDQKELGKLVSIALKKM